MLKTNRCNLQKLQKSDFEQVRELYTNEQVRKFLGGIVGDEAFERSFNGMVNCSEDCFYWVVRLKEKNEFIGLVSLDKHHDGFSTEVSYQFMPQYWGFGFGEEVIRKIIDYAFSELGIDEILAETQTVNNASCKLLQKVGMELKETVMRFGAKQCIFSISK